MKKRSFIHKMLTLGVIAFSITACTDAWDDHYSIDNNIASNNGSTLWEIIESDSSLTQFAELLRKTGYDTLLTKDRFYTVWAPINGFTHNVDDEALEFEFIKNHIADYSHTASGDISKKITMLNEKVMPFVGNTGNYTFKDIPVATANVAAKNGVLHRIGGNGEYVVFVPSIWEFIDKHDSITHFRDYIKSETRYILDRNNSIEGPMQNGQITYLDSVVIESNPWWGRIGALNVEDSSYTMIIPTNAAWDVMLEKAKRYFTYDSNIADGDSLQEAYAKTRMCEHLVFSNTIQKDNGRDSLISNYMVYYNPTVFRYEEKDRLFESSIEEHQLSNGTAHIVTSLNYSPIKCWHDTIAIEGEDIGHNLEYNDPDDKTTRVTYNTVSRDSSYYKLLSKGAYMTFAPLRSSGNTTATYTIPNVLSASYRIKVVLVPAKIQNPFLKDEEVKRTKFNVTLTYRNDRGRAAKQKLGTYVDNYNHLAVDTITLKPDGHEGDYIFTFPICEYNFEEGVDPVTELQFKSDVKTAERDLYDRTLRIDRIIFEPVETVVE